MPARVQIVVEASDAAGGVFRALTSQLGAFGGIIEEVTAKNVSWGNVAQQATQLVIDGLKESIRATTEYAREVRDLSLASGQTAEQSSRMLQVLDDYELSAEDAKTATRALTKEGLAPTIDTIANLSGEFQKLTSVEERNAFVQKNLGRAGQEWLNLLAQGPTKIRAMNDAVSEGLILTEENIQQAEEYRLALDTWGDSVMELKVAIGTQLLPVLTEMVGTVNDDITAMKMMQEQGLNWFTATREQTDAIYAQIEADKQALAATVELGNGMTTAAQSATELEAAEKAAAEAAKAMSQENQAFLGVLGQTGQALTTYRGGLAEANQALADGSITTEEHSTKVNQLKADYEMASKQIVLSIVEMKLAADGWEDAELDAYLKVGKQMGIFTQDQVNMANGAVEMADRIVAGMETVDGPMTHVGERAEDNAVAFGEMTAAGGELGESLRKEVGAGASAATSSLNSIPTQINVDIYIRTHGRIPSLPSNFDGMGAGMCFVRGTPVTLSDGTTKPIEQVQPGDEVRSYDTEGGEFVTGVVTKNFSREVMGYLSVDGILVTEEHPFWVVNRGEWVKAWRLQTGDILLKDNATPRTIRHIFTVGAGGVVEVFNMTVEGVHNYFAGGVLVHNKEVGDGDVASGTQQGGEVFAGVPVGVNEAGREVFMPQQNGRILGHAESLHALSLGGGGGSKYGPFYGPVTIQMSDDSATGFMGLR
jgi:hypothetical protein